MARTKPIIAIMYDFDKTLCTKDMQEYKLIPKFGMKAEEFWAESNEIAKTENMDRILSSLYLMLRKSNEKKIPVNRKGFMEFGKTVEFFDGVVEWFDRINEYGKQNGVKIEHYVISSGLKEIIDGSIIRKEFKEVYACEFHYNENGIADWPKMLVNYTAKTQFLFRINKGVIEVYNDEDLNKNTPEEKRRVPFRNMIYIGDGFTDVPCMKLVKENGGQSIAVYQPGKRQTVVDLLKDKRVDFILPADYSENSDIDKVVKTIIKKMAVVNELVIEHRKQMKSIEMHIKSTK